MLASELIKNAPDIEIEQLSTDSRMPMKNAIFFCIKGVRYDGHHYVKEAIINGAVLIIYEDDIDTNLNAVFVKVSNVFDVLTQIADKFYNYPANDVDTFLISGSYGRTSVASYINQLLSKKLNCASIGLMGIDYNGKLLLSSYSTLPILSNVAYLDKMRNDGVKACTFEANPLNISLKKVDVIHPKIFVYTNTSYLSNDYKEVGDEYFSLLRKYFYSLEEETICILNRDDISFDELVESAPRYLTYGMHENSDFMIHDINIEINESRFALKYDGQVYLIKTNLLSLNNIYNLVAAIASLVAYGINIDEILANIKDLKSVEGVIDKIKNDDYHIIIDPAYALDSIENLFIFANDIKERNKRIYAVIGISFTDDNKRIEGIANLCSKYIDELIITEDDSYEHDTTSILNNASSIVKDLRHIVIEDRISAIETAIELMNKNDILLIIGKGNENVIYKGLGKEYYDSDKVIAEKLLNKRMEEENEISEIY